MIRRMREEDLTQVAELEKKCFSLPWSEENLRQSLEDANYLFLAAENEGRITGYAGLLKVLDEGDVTNVAVDEAYRGRGIGSELVRQLMEEGKKCGIRSFTLEVRVSNVAAVHVYEKLGFVSEGIRKRFYEKPVEDALIMWKREPEQDQ